MDNLQKQKNVHHLALTWRAMLIIPGVMFLLMSLMPFWAGNEATAFSNFISLLLCFAPVTILVIGYAFGCRLVSSEDGLLSYYYFPLRKKIAWSDCKRIELNPFGTVNLVYNSQTQAPFSPKPSNQVLTISAFVENWEDSNLLKDIQEFAPQVSIPEEIYSRKNAAFQYRTSILLIYFVLCIPFMQFPLVIPDSIAGHFEAILTVGSFGWLGGIFSGMLQLMNYSAWLRTEPTSADVKKFARTLYITPFSGCVVALLFGIVFVIVSGRFNLEFMGNTVNILALVIGIFQFPLLRFVFRIGKQK